MDNWAKATKKDEASKYYEVLESLKKNEKVSGLKEYVMRVVCEELKKDVLQERNKRCWSQKGPKSSKSPKYRKISKFQVFQVS